MIFLIYLYQLTILFSYYLNSFDFINISKNIMKLDLLESPISDFYFILNS